MATQQEIELIREMLRRKWYSGVFWGLAISAGLVAGASHSLAEPEIARATLTYSAERVATHNILLDTRNFAAIGAIVFLIIGYLLDRSVDDLAQ